jgi:hypothetical protein
VALTGFVVDEVGWDAILNLAARRAASIPSGGGTDSPIPLSMPA